jgi:hypothetical protein
METTAPSPTSRFMEEAFSPPAITSASPALLHRRQRGGTHNSGSMPSPSLPLSPSRGGLASSEVS